MQWVWIIFAIYVLSLQHFAVMWDHILQLEEFSSDGDIVADESQPVSTSLQLPKS